MLALSAALDGSGAMAGSDHGGQAWAASYDRAARAALQAGQDVGNGCYRLAAMFAQSARNYEAADAASSARSRRVGCRVGCPTTRRSGSARSRRRPPAGRAIRRRLWGWSSTWSATSGPTGIRTGCRRPRRRGTARRRRWTAHAFGAGLASITFARDRLPEADDMITVCQGMNGHLRELASVYRSLAGSCRDLADHIDAVHAAVESETWDLAWQTGAIEGVGFVAGLFSFGLAELPAQAIEGWRLAAIAARIAELIRTFVGRGPRAGADRRRAGRPRQPRDRAAAGDSGRAARRRQRRSRESGTRWSERSVSRWRRCGLRLASGAAYLCISTIPRSSTRS